MAEVPCKSLFIAAVAGLSVTIAVAACSADRSVNLGVSKQLQAARLAAIAAPIQLVPGTTVGKDVFREGDTSTGGQGQQVDGINCRGSLNNQFHHHVHLSLFVNGEQYAIPRGTGMKNPHKSQYVYHADCFYFLHTHDATGIIHIEPPANATYGLHEYFDLWGMPLSTSNVAGYQGPVTVFVNGTQENVDPNTLKFNPYDQITLEVGNPVITPPVYVFPPNYP